MIKRLAHIDFVPSKYVDNNPADKSYIYVFSRKRGKRINKKKVRNIGVVLYNRSEWGFVNSESILLSSKTLLIITDFVLKLKSGEIKFNKKEGDFINE